MSFFFPEVEKIYVYKRKGTQDDPYVPISESLKVVNSRVILKEVPDLFTKVTVKDSNGNFLYETTSLTPNANEYRVDYSLGIVYFNSSNEGKEFIFDYRGVGLIAFPASRIWTRENNGEITETLQTLIDKTEVVRDTANDAADNATTQAQYAQTQGNYAKTQGNYAKTQGDYAQKKAELAATEASNLAQLKTEVQNAATTANNAATNANNAATSATNASNNANDAANNANTKATYAQQQGDYAKTQGDYAKSQGDYAKAQGDYAKTQGNYAKSVADANKTRLLSPVANYASIATTYPNPQFGDTVQTLDDGKFYRYENGKWNFKEQYTGTAINSIVNELSKQNQQSTTIGHGLNVIDASQNSPLDVKIEGRTLVNVSQNVLDPAKYYVLADKKYKVKFSDGTTYTGVAKFQGKAEKPILIRVENFENKVSGSMLENPHVIKVGARTSLDAPSSYTAEFTQTDYSKVNKLDSTFPATSTTIKGAMGQNLFSFNLIEAIERNVGKIPASDTAGKMAWLKNNIAIITFNWWGYGSSPAGNKANIGLWKVATNAWIPNWNSNSSSTPFKTYNSINLTAVQKGEYFDPNGFVHFIAYAEPSDGVTASTIYTDYVELEIELKPEAQLWNPRFPLYEVDATEYANILTVWDENEVMRRYPMVESVQHVQNPFIVAEGENLLPPFTEWNLHANASIKSPYELVLNATAGSWQNTTIKVSVLPNQTYTFNMTSTGSVSILAYRKDGTLIQNLLNIVWANSPRTITTPANTDYILIVFSNNGMSAGTFTFTNPILSLGSTAKPFAPRNPSMLFSEVKLGAIGDKKDILWKDGQDWKVLKWIEKDIPLDGKFAWNFGSDYSGYKRVYADATQYEPVLNSKKEIVVKYNGKILKTIDCYGNEQSSGDEAFISDDGSRNVYISISDADSGWGETYTPTPDEIKAYFNGWQVKTVDGNGKPTAWRSLVDGTDAPTQTLDYVKSNLAPNFTPYKLSYVSATPQTIVVTDKVEGDLVVHGATQVEVGSGFTYTDVDGKRTYTKLAENQRYNVTANILSVIANYDTSLKSVVDSMVAKQRDIAAQVSVNVRAIAELYKRVKALGG